MKNKYFQFFTGLIVIVLIILGLISLVKAILATVIGSVVVFCALFFVSLLSYTKNFKSSTYSKGNNLVTDPSSLNIEDLDISTGPLSLYQFSLRKSLSNSDEFNTELIISYLKSRVHTDLDYLNLPVEFIHRLIVYTDSLVPESSNKFLNTEEAEEGDIEANLDNFKAGIVN